jgi:protein-tyrosine phosphatase
MVKIMFVCHGNICRSTMAEFVLKDMVKKRGLEDSFFIASSATSTEEIGNPVHRGTKKKLAEYGISSENKFAVQIRKSDYEKYDYIIAMDQRNIINMQRILGQDPHNKICRLLDFTEDPRDIKDPWYTGNFDETYEDVYQGCEKLLMSILNYRAS